MEQGQPSATAQGAALQRAVHQLLEKPVVFVDPLALQIIGAEAEAEMRANPDHFQTSYLRRQRANIVARTRHAEIELAAAIRRGVRQYVVLGAGLDTFAYREPFETPSIDVFEIDHPATQAWKRQRVTDRGIAPRRPLTYVPVDFERERLEDALRKAGFDRAKPAFVSWLGVTTYLTRDAIFETLGAIASLAAGTTIVFNYAGTPDSLSPEQRESFDAEAKRVAAIGEPWHSFFVPAQLAQDLREIGFKTIEDLGPDEINARYFSGRSDGFAGGYIGHLLRATV